MLSFKSYFSVRWRKKGLDNRSNLIKWGKPLVSTKCDKMNHHAINVLLE